MHSAHRGGRSVRPSTPLARLGQGLTPHTTHHTPHTTHDTPHTTQLEVKAFGGNTVEQNADVLERTLPVWFQWAFVFARREDERTLRQALGKDLGSKISYVSVEAATQQLEYDTRSLAADGVIGTAADVSEPRVHQCAASRGCPGAHPL